MNPTQRKLKLETFEERAVPATLQSVAMAQALNSFMDDYEWMAHPTARGFAQSFFTGLYAESAGSSDPMSQASAQLAQHFGNWLGFNVVPPPIVIQIPEPEIPPPTDAGMTNTMPSADDSNWVLQQNGLKTWDVVVGTDGDAVVAGDSVSAFYTGWLLNGTVFDSQRTPETPAPFSLNSVIEGWKQGIPGMKNGGIRRLYIPSALGYGAAGTTGIPANSDLIFEVKMISHT